jgi:hypothetical protein
MGQAVTKGGWVGVDLDGTLAHYEGWNGGVIGMPVPAMAARVRQWLAEGREVRIVTARVAAIFLPNATEEAREEARQQRERITAWCFNHFDAMMPVTAVKDFAMVELWDDRCIQVVPNTGQRADGKEWQTVSRDPCPEGRACIDRDCQLRHPPSLFGPRGGRVEAKPL